jgi:lysophospholipase L1-like esterase
VVSSIARSTASGSTAVFSVPFPYLDKTHVQMRLQRGASCCGCDYTWPTASTVQITAGNPAAGTVVERKRVTPTDPLTIFAPGNLDTTDLNVGILQPLYVAQEATDAAGDTESLAVAAAATATEQALIATAAATALGNQVHQYDTKAMAAAATIPVGVQSIRTQGFYSVGDGGAALYKRAVSGQFQSVDGAWWALGETDPSLLQFGGTDDNATSNYAALLLARTYLGSTAKRLHLPFRNTGIYYFNPASGAADFRGITITADAGVIIRGQPRFDEDIRVGSDIQVQYVDVSGLYYNNYKFSPVFGQPIDRKANFLRGGDLERKKLKALDFNTHSPEKLSFASGDTWVADAGFGLTADTASYNLTSDGFMHAIFEPVRGGDEVAIAFANTNFIKAAIVRFVGGYMAFYAGTGFGVFRTKLTGVAAAENTGLTWAQATTNPAWAPEKSEWKIRIYNANTFSVLLNGKEIIEPITTPGPIVDAGFGLFWLTNLLAAMNYSTKTRRKEPYGLSPMRLLVCGDSTSEARAGGWPLFAKEFIDGSFGARVWNVYNQAVSGHTSANQLAALLANPNRTTSTHAIIAVGINDDQSGGPAASITNIGSMIDSCNSAGIPNRRIVLVAPHLWYTQALSGGSGINTGTNDMHGPLRAAIKKLAAVRGCPVVDMQEVFTGVTPDDLTRPLDVDPLVRDNIHQTLWGYKLQGDAIAKAILANTVPEMTGDESYTLFNASLFRNSWISNAGQPFGYSVKGGIVTLHGKMDKGTVTEPVVIANLPANLRPPATRALKAGSRRYLDFIINQTDLLAGTGHRNHRARGLRGGSHSLLRAGSSHHGRHLTLKKTVTTALDTVVSAALTQTIANSAVKGAQQLTSDLTALATLKLLAGDRLAIVPASFATAGAIIGTVVVRSISLAPALP